MQSSAFAFVALLVVTVWSPRATAQADDAAFFASQIHPLLAKHCFSCHGEKRQRAGLDLRSRDMLLRGGDTGPAFDAAEPAKSLLLAMISYVDEDHQMPPKGKLDDAALTTLSEWIRRGAPYAATEPLPHGDEEPERKPLHADGRSGWSYRPIVAADPPRVDDETWCATPVDRFILAGLEAKGLSPAPPADRRAWLRRATFDLTGLPPTPAEMDDFLADESDDRAARSRVVDRLLASPHYGEKQARHWLDVVRYAETNGFERDTDKPGIWRYRDWVVDAFNRDLPYDTFTLHQLAGDEIENPTKDSITATAYYRLMQWDDEPGAGALQARYDVLDDVVRTTSGAFLGVSLGCARCHDHKADPITQVDYYSFMAYFHGLTDMSVDDYLHDVSSPERRRAHDEARAAKVAEIDAINADLATIEDAARRRALVEGRGNLGDRPALENLHYRFYRGGFDRVDELRDARPEAEGELAGGLIDLAPATRRDDIGFSFAGTFRAAADGRYEFFARSHRRIELEVGGQRVIARGARHDDRLRRGVAWLRAGAHPLHLSYVNRAAREYGLELHWRRIPEGDWRYVTEDPGPEFMTEAFDDRLWARGGAGFGAPGTPGSMIGTEWHTAALWMRRDFIWSGAPEDLVFAVHHDDDIEVYVNGVAALERSGYVVAYDIHEASDAARAALRPGKNLIAVRCRQDFGGQYVHVEPITRLEAAGRTARDAAFDLRPLSVDGALGGTEALNELMQRDGARLVGEVEAARWTELTRTLETVRKRRLPELELRPAVQERGREPKRLFVHVRGNAASPGEPVEPRVPAILGGEGAMTIEPVAGSESSGRRLALARWITDATLNPLFDRVAVNRIWQNTFGRGLVRSSLDFGELGERPTHPELLDWLAAEFARRGRSVKSLQRLLVLSSAYAQSSSTTAVTREIDGANDLFSRFDLRRLSAEELRDAAIAVTGRLNRRIGGESFFSLMPAAALATSSRPDEVWGRSSDEDRRRRSLYIKVKRSLLTPLLTVFDFADTDQNCPARFTTTHPGQAFTLLNGDFAAAQAEALRDRVLAAAASDDDRQTFLWRETLQRAPDDFERAENRRFLGDLRATHGLDEGAAWERLCLLVLNLNEFIYLE